MLLRVQWTNWRCTSCVMWCPLGLTEGMDRRAFEALQISLHFGRASALCKNAPTSKQLWRHDMVVLLSQRGQQKSQHVLKDSWVFTEMFAWLPYIPPCFPEGDKGESRALGYWRTKRSPVLLHYRVMFQGAFQTWPSSFISEMLQPLRSICLATYICTLAVYSILSTPNSLSIHPSIHGQRD